jgi:hypothetical protein
MILERTNIVVLEKKTIYIGETTMLAQYTEDCFVGMA